jgi:sulfide:quinone oxidoreductase
MAESFNILIVGGGAAGITIAAALRRRNRQLKVGLIEPNEAHYYQPALTLVGSGEQTVAQNTRLEAHLIPDNTTWIKDSAVTFEPEDNRVLLEKGDPVNYDYLVVCPGLKCDWDKVEGLKETLGKNNVSSNYSHDFAPYTWECIQKLTSADGPAVFTQPPMPIKCPGAPQKIVYLAADYFKKKRRNLDVAFHSATPGIFGVPYFARAMDKVITRHNVDFHTQSNLTKVDGENKIATFTSPDDESTDVKFGMLHVTPPQCAPDFIRDSPLADDAGWMDVDKTTLQSTRYPNIFGLGDVTNTPNSKTAAAVRKQAPVVLDHILALKAGREMTSEYDGYASCPLTTAYGEMVLAEFRYGGQVTPTIPLSPRIARRSYWYIKKWGLAVLYWSYMLKGYEWDVAHNINFVEDDLDEIPAEN